MAESDGEEREMWLCECGQGEPAEHWICSLCGDDWDECICTKPHGSAATGTDAFTANLAAPHIPNDVEGGEADV